MEVMRNQNDSASGEAATARYLYNIIYSIHNLYTCYCYNHQHVLHVEYRLKCVLNVCECVNLI